MVRWMRGGGEGGWTKLHQPGLSRSRPCWSASTLQPRAALACPPPHRRQVERAPVGVCKRARGPGSRQACAEAQVEDIPCTAQQLESGLQHASRRDGSQRRRWRCRGVQASLQARGRNGPGRGAASSSGVAQTGERQWPHQRTVLHVPAAPGNDGGGAPAGARRE